MAAILILKTTAGVLMMAMILKMTVTAAMMMKMTAAMVVEMVMEMVVMTGTVTTPEKTTAKMTMATVAMVAGDEASADLVTKLLLEKEAWRMRMAPESRQTLKATARATSTV